MPKIVYLEARGRGAYRSQLRSDTLWGMLCWRIRQMAEALGENNFELSRFIQSYKKAAPESFYVSSAFPWIEQGGERTHFLPSPIILPPLHEKVAAISWQNPTAAKNFMRERKGEEKRRKGWLSWQHFAYHFAGGSAPTVGHAQVQRRTLAVTHNQIDRRRLGTFSENENGQLFHMNENYLDWSAIDATKGAVDRHGLYFLLAGEDTSRVEGALRLLDTLGMGGDRRTGKGSFRIYVEPDVYDLQKSTYLKQAQFSLPHVSTADANARLNLSLYHPHCGQDELQAYEGAAEKEGRFWQYRLEARQGRNVHQGQVLQDGKLLFTEGSVFPMIVDQKPYPGQNWQAGKHRMGHDIFRFGHAFLLNIKLK